jgi:general secretion pathway protein N
MLVRHKGNLILAIVVCTVMVICIALWQRRTHSIVWPELSSVPTPELPLSTIGPVTALPLSAYAATWERPLFNPLRLPDPLATLTPMMAPNLDDMVVTGIVVTEVTRVVLIKQGENRLKVKEGDVLPNGWKVNMISERQVQLSYGSKNETLWLSGTKPKF